MTRVDLLTPRFWPEVRRGTERFTWELADELRARGHAPRVITSHRGAQAGSIHDGVEIVRVRRLPEAWMRRAGIDEPVAHLPLAYRELARGGADVAHAMTLPDAAAALAWRRRGGCPTILSFMGIPDVAALGPRHPRRRLLERVLSSVDAVVALSSAAREVLRVRLGVDADLIPPGVNLERFPLCDQRAPQPTFICAADATEPRKNVGVLLEAFTQLRRSRPSARLVLSRPADGALARKLLRDGVDLLDLDDTRAMARANGEAWVSVLPSSGEAFGMVLIEALATGTPVVGVADGGMADIVDRPEIGRLVGTPEVDDLCRAMLEALDLAHDAGTRKACRARAAEFSTAACAERHIALYSRIV